MDFPTPTRLGAPRKSKADAGARSFSVLKTLKLSEAKEKVEMKTLRFLTGVLVSLVLLMFGAVGVVVAQDVRYDFDKNKDFSKYKTYKWVPIKGADQIDDLTAQKLTAAIDAELTKKGLSKTDADTADLYLGYQTAVGTEKQFTSYNTGWGYGPGWGGRWYGGGMNTSYGTTSTVYIGQLDLSMYDSTQKQLVWRGMASKTLDTKAKPEKREKNIAKAVEKLLKNYPPPVKK